MLVRYAKAMKIDTEPTLNWWINKALNQIKRILQWVTGQYYKINIKFGLFVSHKIKEDLLIDNRTTIIFGVTQLTKR